MARGNVTLGDVAREVGVSVGTASEALSGRGRMTPATRDAVRTTAQRLGYRPNALARGLRTGRTYAIGLHRLHAPDNFDAEYFRELVAGIMDVAVQHDYDVSVLSSNPTRRRNVAPQVDGVIIADPISDDVRAIDLLSSGIPVVSGERFPPGMPASPVVGIDHQSALETLLDHAHDAGVRRPLLYATGPTSGWGIALREAFEAWCEKHSVTGQVRATGFRGRRFHEEEDDHLTSVLTGPEPVDLVIVPGEHAALATLRIIRATGLEPGADVLVAACADAHVLEVCDPPVTAIDLSPRRLGRACADALVSLLDGGPDIPAQTLLPSSVVFRRSTERRRQTIQQPTQEEPR